MTALTHRRIALRRARRRYYAAVGAFLARPSTVRRGELRAAEAAVAFARSAVRCAEWRVIDGPVPEPRVWASAIWRAA